MGNRDNATTSMQPSANNPLLAVTTSDAATQNRTFELNTSNNGGNKKEGE